MTTANTNQYQLLVISEEDAIFNGIWGGVFFFLWLPFVSFNYDSTFPNEHGYPLVI